QQSTSYNARALTNSGQERQTQELAPSTAANNNNSQILSDGIIKHNCESAMSTTRTSPEMPIDGQRFPLQRRQRAPFACNPQQTHQLQQQLAKKHVTLVPGKFPLRQTPTAHRFPMQQQSEQQQQLFKLSSCSITPRFPLQMNHLSVGQRFPLLCQLPKKNFNYSIKITRERGCRTPLAMSRTPKEFPTIKKQFVSFPNNQRTCKRVANANADGVADANTNAGHGNCQAKAARTDVNVLVGPTPATMTQMSHNPSTKIDMDSPRTVETEHDDLDVDVDVVSFDVHKATCDNELNAHEQTLNLNVEAAAKAEGVGERKEIEHQQAENFNDAFGRRHHNANDNDNNENHDDGNAGEGEGNDDAMNAISAKNKHEICEQSKLETTAATHNELNMTKEQQSICLASERARQSQTIAEAAAASYNNRPSDARGSSSEQVDGQQRQEINVKSHAPTIVTQNDTQAASSSSSLPSSPLLSSPLSSSLSGHPSIEFFECAVRELLEEGASRVSLEDLDLFDLLRELVQLLATPTFANTATTNTGLLWSEPLLLEVVSECVDMTVSRVSDDSETATAAVVDIYNEQIEQQPLELDDNNSNNNNNNSSSNNQADMKYEVLRSSSRLPESLPSNRLPSTAATPVTPTAATTATARIRDVPTAATTRPLLGELKRNSSSRDDVSVDVDSVLPERTRLRRQRRMRSQDSVEEKPEDVVERINKLKARISASLSEVKNVIKQYSTESEAEAAGEKWLGPPTTAAAKVETETVAEKPVQFRFVKKVRRRSYFDEAEEEKDQAKEPANEDKTEKESTPLIKEPEQSKDRELSTKEQQKTKAAKELQKDYTEAKPTNKTDAEDHKIAKHETDQLHDECTKELIAVKDEKKQKTPTDAAEKPKTTEFKQATNVQQKQPTAVKETQEQEHKVQLQTPVINGELPKEKAKEKDKVQSKIEFLAKVQSELKAKPKPKELTTIKEQPQEAAVKTITTTIAPAATIEPTATKPATEITATAPIMTTTPAVTTKKKTVVKARNPRRASIAAVEQSRIVPEAVQSDALTQRRPSDSEAIVKRKKKQKLTSSVANATASGSSNQTAAAATAAATTTTGINEQLVAAKVESHESTAKRVTKPTAKSVEDEEQKTAAAAATSATAIEATAATTKAAAANEAAAAAATTVTATAAETAPKQLPIDVIANKAPASESSRRASLKLAELVGETVLVVPAAAAATATTQDLSTAAATLKTSEATSELATAPAIATPDLIGQSKEPINQSGIIIPATATPKQVAVASGDIEVAPAVDVVVSATPQIAATLSEVPHDENVADESSPQKHQHDQQQTEQQHQEQSHQQQLVEATKDSAAEQTDDSLAAMPELKVLAGPVQPVKIETVEQPHDESDLSVVKKKSPHLKKLVRKSSIDKGKEKVVNSEPNKQLSNILKDKNKISNLTDRINKLTPPKKQTKAKEQTTVADTQHQQQENAEIPDIKSDEQEVATDVAESEDVPELEPEPEPEPAKPKKPRQIKKKVIIKRQQRRLSIGDTFFIQQEPEEPKVPEIETIEKAIAYVTDDDEDLEPLPDQEPAKPMKSCLHVREYKIGDLILYAERYRKTQVRWKRGRVLERITSISYKLEIEGKEVPAHISYIKKYTGRKVKFVGKEYLDIDYEQVVEEERRARSYSIWNMV
ncbi:hypothetical protein KR093_006488, partial [Drosophila rubida]